MMIPCARDDDDDGFDRARGEDDTFARVRVVARRRASRRVVALERVATSIVRRTRRRSFVRSIDRSAVMPPRGMSAEVRAGDSSRRRRVVVARDASSSSSSSSSSSRCSDFIHVKDLNPSRRATMDARDDDDDDDDEETTETETERASIDRLTRVPAPSG